MKASSIFLASLLQIIAHATEQNEKPHLRRATEAVEAESQTLEQAPRPPHKHEPRAPRGEKQSKMVTYFTMGGNNNTDDARSRESQPRAPRGEKQSKLVTYFTMGGNNNTDEYDGDKDVRIVGGSQSSAGEFPYYVDLRGNCGGSLIAPNVVLTAAHCGSFQGKNIIVGAYRAGSTQNNAVRVRVSGEERHPNYDDFTLANDFQLLRLAEDVTVGGSNVVLSINNQFSSPGNGEALTVMGHGLTSETGDNTPNKLRDVEIKAIATNTCNQPNAYNGEVEGDTMFCAGVDGGGKDSCQGDSGGPLVKRVGNKHIQVGVVSWGDGCGRRNKPGVYARVSSAFNWIQQVACNQWNSNADFCGGSAPAPAPAPTPPSPAPPSGNGSCVQLVLNLRTDDYGSDTELFLLSGTGNLIWNGNGFADNKKYQFSACLDRNGCTTLGVYDAWGDGIESPGYVKLTADGQVAFHSGNIGGGISARIGNGC